MAEQKKKRGRAFWSRAGTILFRGESKKKVVQQRILRRKRKRKRAERSRHTVWAAIEQRRDLGLSLYSLIGLRCSHTSHLTSDTHAAEKGAEERKGKKVLESKGSSSLRRVQQKLGGKTEGKNRFEEDFGYLERKWALGESRGAAQLKNQSGDNTEHTEKVISDSLFLVFAFSY